MDGTIGYRNEEWPDSIMIIDPVLPELFLLPAAFLSLFLSLLHRHFHQNQPRIVRKTNNDY